MQHAQMYRLSKSRSGTGTGRRREPLTGDGPAALGNDDCRVSGALLHEPEIVIRVLVVVLGLNGISCRGCGVRQGKIAVASLFPVSRTLPAIVAGIGVEPGLVLTSAVGFVSLGIHGCSSAIRMAASRFSRMAGRAVNWPERILDPTGGRATPAPRRVLQVSTRSRAWSVPDAPRLDASRAPCRRRLALAADTLTSPCTRKRLPAQQAFPDLGIGRGPCLDVGVHCDASLPGFFRSWEQNAAAQHARLIGSAGQKDLRRTPPYLCCPLDGGRCLNYQARGPRVRHQRGSLKGRRMMMPATKNIRMVDMPTRCERKRSVASPRRRGPAKIVTLPASS